MRNNILKSLAILGTTGLLATGCGLSAADFKDGQEPGKNEQDNPPTPTPEPTPGKSGKLSLGMPKKRPHDRIQTVEIELISNSANLDCNVVYSHDDGAMEEDEAPAKKEKKDTTSASSSSKKTSDDSDSTDDYRGDDDGSGSDGTDGGWACGDGDRCYPEPQPEPAPYPYPDCGSGFHGYYSFDYEEGGTVDIPDLIPDGYTVVVRLIEDSKYGGRVIEEGSGYAEVVAGEQSYVTISLYEVEHSGLSIEIVRAGEKKDPVWADDEQRYPKCGNE